MSESKKDLKKCFFITPIGESDSDERKLADSYLDILKRPLEIKGYDLIRSDRYNNAGKLDIQIFDLITKSELAIVNITNGNPNVFYELALRHAVRKPFILIKHPKSKKLPFDIITLNTIPIDPQTIQSIQESYGIITEMIDNIENGTSDCYLDSPISMIDTLNRIGKNGAISIDKLFEQLSSILNTLENKNNDISTLKSEFDRNKDFLEWKNNKQIFDTLTWIKEELNESLESKKELRKLYESTKANFTAVDVKDENSIFYQISSAFKSLASITPGSSWINILSNRKRIIELEDKINILIKEIDELIKKE